MSPPGSKAITLRPAPGLLKPQNLERWQLLAGAVQSFVPPSGFQRALPEEVAAWDPWEQEAWLETALAVAPRGPRAAVTVYRETPPALAGLTPGLRTLLLRILRQAAPSADPGDLAALIPLLGVLILEIPRSGRTDALQLALSVAERCPAAALGMIRSLPSIAEEATGERVRQWAERGLEIASANPDAARAYFALESRTSLRVLHSSPTAAALEEVEGVLHRYIQMLSGTPAPRGDA